MNKLIRDLGENYEYLRIIVENQIELKKLNLIDHSAKFVGIGILSLIMLILGLLTVLSLSAITILFLISILDSPTQAHLAFIGIIFFIGIILYTFRTKIILNPSRKIFFSLLKDII